MEKIYGFTHDILVIKLQERVQNGTFNHLACTICASYFVVDFFMHSLTLVVHRMNFYGPRAQTQDLEPLEKIEQNAHKIE